MISKNIIEKILHLGCMAPSGGNSQPWKFEVENNNIKVIALPEKDHPILNVEHRGTLIAHGALIENIRIAASNFNIETHVKLFPYGKESETIADIELKKNDSLVSDEYYSEIERRTTNRKSYHNKPIDDRLISEFKKLSLQFSNLHITFLSNNEQIKSIAKNLSIGDRIMFENKTLSKLFFKELVWNKQDEKMKGGGLLVDTLEIKPPQRLILRLINYKPFMYLALKVGLPKIIAKENENTYSSSPLMCVISTKNDDKLSFIEVGKYIEKLWLMATKEKLSCQIISGLFFFKQGIDTSSHSIFSKKEVGDIENAYSSINKIVGNSDNSIITAVLRIGYTDEPSSRSYKPEPIIDWKKSS